MNSSQIPTTPLQKSAVPIQDDLESMIALNKHIETKSREGIEKLFLDGLNINIRSTGYTQITPIVKAILTEDLDWVKEVVEIFTKFGQPLNLTTPSVIKEPFVRRSPLWVASQVSVSIAEYLLTELEVKPKQKEFLDILSYFYIFCTFDIRPLLKLFVHHGFDVNFGSPNRQTLLCLAVDEYEEEFVYTKPNPEFTRELIEDYGAKVTPAVLRIIDRLSYEIKPILKVIELVKSNI